MLKLFEAFSGVGAQRMALRNLGIEHESVGVSEIDIPALISYSAIHEDLLGDTDFNYPSKEEMIEYLESKRIGLDVKTGKIKLPKQLDKLKLIYKASVLSKCVGDISIIDPHDLPDMDLFTYSFPCQDLSVAGQGAGMIKGQTRSGLLYECEKIIEVKHPKYLLLENVKNLVGKNFKSQFEEWLAYLESLGYTNYWQVLNAKDWVPQNRERVFVISILNDENKGYSFPQKQPLEIRLKDILENQVEDKYFLSDEVQARFKPNDKFKGMNCNDSHNVNEIGYLPYSNANKKHQSNVVYGIDGISPTLTARDYKAPVKVVAEHNRIRKLTPKECWRLMGFSGDDFNKAKSVGTSNSQLYKQAGNSIVVPVLEGIFESLINNAKER